MAKYETAKVNTREVEDEEAEAEPEIRQSEAEPEEEAEIAHYQVMDTDKFVPLCQADGDDVHLTNQIEYVTCPDCNGRFPL